MTPNVAEKLTALPASTDAEAQTSITPLNEGEIVRDVQEFFERKRQERRPYESVWYLNAAALAGQVQTRFNPAVGRVEVSKMPAHRRYLNINVIWTKFSAKLAKMINSRPRAVVVAANQDYNEILNARLSQQALLYITRKGDWEKKFEKAVAQSEITGKSFMWIWWDPNLKGTFKDPRTGKPFDFADGDVRVETGSAFEILVEDAGEMYLGNQKSIMRVDAMLIDDAKFQYGDKLKDIELKSDVNDDDLFMFERQIADIGARGAAANGLPIGGGRGGDQLKGNAQKYLLRKQRFWAPTDNYPMGRYAVVIADRLVTYQEELPYGFSDMQSNPYPVEEISADIAPGQFWPQTMIERMRPLAKLLDDVISKIAEDMDVALHPKMFIPRAARLNPNAFNSEAGEKITFNHFPGMPLPFILQPRGVGQDAWRTLDWLLKMMDVVTNIYPASLGAQGGATSGFQTNLLQEAADAVYGPHKRRSERAWEGLLLKARRLMKSGYTVERLISVTSKSQIPAVFEFHQSNIDEHAEIKVEIGSALSDLKATRLQQALELRGSGLFGPNDSPQAKRAMMSLIDLGGVEEQVDPTYADTQRALLENMNIGKGENVPPPAPWQTDQIHIELHFNQMNSPEFDSWEDTQKAMMMQHVVLHLRRHNPQMGLEIAQMGMGIDPTVFTPLVQELTAMTQQQAAAPPATSAPGGAPAPPQGGPPAPPQGAA